MQFNREGVLLLRGLDSRLTKDLPPDLQKLRCKVKTKFIFLWQFGTFFICLFGCKPESAFESFSVEQYSIFSVEKFSKALIVCIQIGPMCQLNVDSKCSHFSFRLLFMV